VTSFMRQRYLLLDPLRLPFIMRQQVRRNAVLQRQGRTSRFLVAGAPRNDINGLLCLPQFPMLFWLCLSNLPKSKNIRSFRPQGEILLFPLPLVVKNECKKSMFCLKISRRRRSSKRQTQEKRHPCQETHPHPGPLPEGEGTVSCAGHSERM